MAMDFGREMRVAIKTGKVVLGSDRTGKMLRDGEVRLLVVASNSPPGLESVIGSHPDVPIYRFGGKNTELGSICGKPFPVSVISVLDPGNSGIMKVAE